jgi:DNA-binding NarL/FixJ family response regulator
MKKADPPARTESRKRILILDDHPMTRHGLAQLINREPDIAVCGEATVASQAFAAIPSTKPDLVLADITMPGKSGLEFIKDMKAHYPEIPILVISMHSESIYAERVLRSGGRGYVMKSEGGERVLEAIRHVLDGAIYVSRGMAAVLLDNWSQIRSPDTDRPLRVLTDREFEIFQLIGQGVPTTEISRRLHVSVKTVGTHRVHIKQKLNIKSGTELVQHAVQWITTQGAG